MTARRLAWVSLEGEKIALRPIQRDDAEAAFALLHRREPILRWLLWEGPAEVAELERFYADWARPNDHGWDYHFAIVEREQGALAGTIGVRFAGHPETGDLGYWLAERCWGRGYMTEAIALVSHLTFTYLDALSLCAWVFVGNQASRRALEKNGFTWVHTRERGAHKRGTAIDEWYLALLRSEWQARSRLVLPNREEVRFA